MTFTGIQFRKFHRKVAPVLLLPLLLSSFTGIGYRIGRTWFGLSDDFGDVMMTLHEGRFLGKPLVPLYVLFIGLGLLSLAITGMTMMRKKKARPVATDQPQSSQGKFTVRSLHSWLAPLVFLPFLVTAITGVGYRLGKAWFHLPADYTKLLMKIHQGSYLGSTLRAYYVLLIGLGLLAMLVTGIQMTGLFRPRRSSSSN